MKILMVCLGNICRSPLAHGILQKKINEINLPWTVDSAGTSSFHSGELPDVRSIEVGKKNGIDITNQRSRQIISDDLKVFDLVVAMDSANYRDIRALAENADQESKVKLLLNFAHPNENRGVPDPYHHGGFQSVYDMIEESIDALIKEYSN